MKLEQKFDNLIPIEFGGEMQEPLRSECAQITRTFTIGFAEWYFTNKPKYDAGHSFEGMSALTIEQLLEIYEKTL